MARAVRVGLTVEAGKEHAPEPGAKKYLIRVRGLETWSAWGKRFKEGDTVTYDKNVALAAADTHLTGGASVTVLGLTRTEMKNPYPKEPEPTFDFNEGEDGWDPDNEDSAADPE